ncbi:MAG: DUF3570 domain-containing protein [Xanthomonadales bacterium]|nr:DUF3570 domain-containing protein [Xanthomonadales bacterium]
MAPGQRAEAAAATDSKMERYSKAIRSLLATSLGLPGMQDLLAKELPEEGADYRYTFYDEDPIPQNRLAFGDPRRYEIESHQFRVVKNIDDSYGLELNFQHETMSGSSPWYAVPGPDGPLQVMSGATIRERRNQADAGVRFLRGDWSHHAAVGYSSENDYVARYGSYSVELESADGLRVTSWGVSYSNDEVTPTDAREFGRVESADRDALSGSLSVTQVLSRNTVLQGGVSLTRQSGFLSDPYKLVWIGGAVIAENRPDERRMLTWTARLRHFVEGPEAALSMDYRYFRDDWDVAAHTLDISWKQPIGETWEVIPSVRYHAQSAPDFYAPYFLSQPGGIHWSSDYRLGTFGALSYRLHARLKGEKWSLSMGAEYYDSDESLALATPHFDSPGLVSFWRLSAALRFLY